MAPEAQLKALIESAQQGDEAAFERIFEEHYDLIYRFAYKWCRNVTDAEDVTQQSCIKLANSLNQYRFESAFTSWLYRLVINTAKDWGKSQARHQGSDAEAGLHEESSSRVQNENATYLEQVLRLLDSMAEGFKETALLVFAEGWTHVEAAEALGIKESTVSWRIHEIRKQLKAMKEEGLL